MGPRVLINGIWYKTFALFTLRNKLRNNQVQWISFEADGDLEWEPGVEIMIPGAAVPRLHPSSD